MILYCLRRILTTIPVFFGVVTLAFLLVHLIPGDPVDMMLGDMAGEADKLRLRGELGLNLPITQQYLQFLRNVFLHFDFGTSIQSKIPVTQEILARFPATAELAFSALVLATIIGVPLGIVSALKKYSSFDHVLSFIGLIGMSLPGYWLGPMLIWLFAIHLGWLPVSDRDGLSHLILPAVSLAVALASVQMRMSRVAMLDTIREDYIHTAKAKGLGNFGIYFKHALANALIPIVTVISLQFGALLTGTVITETIFDWPGIGTLLLSSIQQRNYPMVQGCVLFIAFIYVFINLVTDLVYGLVNPKIRALQRSEAA